MKSLNGAFVFAVLLCFLACRVASATAVSVNFTAPQLGLGDFAINRGSTIDPDMPGFVTSYDGGPGSILTIQTNGLAGDGTDEHPVFLTVTAKGHTNSLFGSFGSDDYRRGVIYIPGKAKKKKHGDDEGLGVRSRKVTVSAMGSERSSVKIVGSKEVSPGRDHGWSFGSYSNWSRYDGEQINFEFAPGSYADVMTLGLRLNKLKKSDVFGLRIELADGADIDLTSLQVSNAGVFEEIGNGRKMFKLNFSGIEGLNSGDMITGFSIGAGVVAQKDKAYTASHFLVAGLDYIPMQPVPEPATAAILGMGVMFMFVRKKRV